MHWIIWPLLGYLIGGIPFGLVLAKNIKGIDIREVGSRNTGATNVARTCGLGIGITALILDILKGLVPVVLAGTYGNSDGAFFMSICALAPLLGHCYSPYLGFKGGKAVATTVGVFLGLSFWPALLSVILCLAGIFLSGYVSVGSLVFGASLPLTLLILGPQSFVPVAFLVTLLLFWRHRANIERLRNGEENPWRKKKENGEE